MFSFYRKIKSPFIKIHSHTRAQNYNDEAVWNIKVQRKLKMNQSKKKDCKERNDEYKQKKIHLLGDENNNTQ